MNTIVSGKSNRVYNLGVPKGMCTMPDAGSGGLYKSSGAEFSGGAVVSLKKPRTYTTELPTDFKAECLIIPPDTVLSPGFTGIGRTGGECGFYYEEEKIAELTDTEHRVAVMGDKIYIFPEKLCFSDDGIESMERSATDTFTFAEDGTITLEDFDFSQYFKKGDSLTISGGKNATYIMDSPDDLAPEGEIAHICVQSSRDGEMKTAVYGSSGETLSFTRATEECTISLKIPDMRCVCVHKNRLWGTEKGVPGRFIYGSSPGNGSVFGRFRGIASDSWWGEVASPGSFSACAPYGTHAVFFKKNSMHFLYGTSPDSFSLPHTASGGCINSKTVAEASGCLYFLGISGIMQLSGTTARCISENVPELANTICGAAFCGNYYAATEGGLYCYYPQRAAWLCIDGKKYDALAASGNHFIGISGNEMTMFSKRGEEGCDDFLLVSSRIILPESPASGVISAVFTADIKEGELSFYIDSGDGFKLCGTSDGTGLCHTRVPVRLRYGDSFRYKISGTGDFVLLGVEVTT